MKHLDFHFDLVSPYAYLAFERLPQVLEGLNVVVSYRPVLFAGLLQHWGQKGPAEIAPKRAWTYRQVSWLAQRHGIALQIPAQHPFNPLALLRLAVACAPPLGSPSRSVCDQLFRHVWQGGGDANDAARLQTLRASLAPPLDPEGDAVKQALKQATAQAAAAGIFGVPMVTVDGRQFWGLDGLAMLADSLRGAPWFDGGAWEGVAADRPGVQRRA